MNEEKSAFEKDYSDSGYWDKVKTVAAAAGKEVIDKALQLYYAMQASTTPAWAKGVIIGSLGYFISPVDAIPDVIPGIGYVDDLAVLSAAVATVGTSITDEIKTKAEVKLTEWFGK